MAFGEFANKGEAPAAPAAAGAPTFGVDSCAGGMMGSLGVLGLGTAVEAQLRKLLATGKPVRLGILGGTFDPVHNGHVFCAQQAIDQAKLDLVLFMPAGVPVFKLDKPVTAGSHRLEMCRRAIAGNPRFAVSAMELQRQGKTFTADTLRAMRAALPARVQLFFIVGADSLNTFQKWREHRIIAQLATLVAFSRPGYPVPQQQKDALAADGVRVLYAPSCPPAISSTDIREKVRRGEQVRALVPASVYDYLCENGLYETACEEEGRVHGEA